MRTGGERNRTLSIIKSRGMAHSNQACEYTLSERGLTLLDTYLGPAGVQTGSARLAREADDAAAARAGAEEIARKERERAQRRSAVEREIAALKERFEAEDAALAQSILEAVRSRDLATADRGAMARSRKEFAGPGRDRSRPSNGRRA